MNKTSHHNKENDFLFTDTELKDENLDAFSKASDNNRSETFYQDHHPWKNNKDARQPFYDATEINDDDHLAKTVEK